MKIDGKVTASRLKAALKQKKHLAWVGAILCLGALLGFTLSQLNSQKVTVWETGSLQSCYMTAETEASLQEICREAGVDFSLLIRSSEDAYYDAAFSTSGVYVSDIFLLTRAEMERYQHDEVFLDLQGTELEAMGAEGFYREEALLGIPLEEDKFLALNSRSEIDRALLMTLAMKILEGGRL